MKSGVFDVRRDFSDFLRQTAEVDSYPDYFAAGNRRNDSFNTIRTLVSQAIPLPTGREILIEEDNSNWHDEPLCRMRTRWCF
jgi:hypothetical protein